MVVGGTQARLDLCREFGATDLLNRHELSPDERRDLVMETTDGEGADLVVEATGARGAVEEGIGLLRKGGVYATTGYSQPSGVETLDFFRQVVSRNVRIQGVWVSDTSHLNKALGLVMAHPEVFAKLVTHRFGLDEVNDALDAMGDRSALKAVLIP